MLLLKGQEGQGERSPWGSSLSGAGMWGCTCPYLLPANLHWLLENSPDDGLAAVGGGEGALVAVVAREAASTRQQSAQAEGGGQIHRVPCGAKTGALSLSPARGVVGTAGPPPSISPQQMNPETSRFPNPLGSIPDLPTARAPLSCPALMRRGLTSMGDIPQPCHDGVVVGVSGFRDLCTGRISG